METNFEVRSFDAAIDPAAYARLSKSGLYLVLDNLRSAFNVGAIFRTADALRVSGIFCCGYTAFPPHDKLAKTSLGTVEYVPWRHFDTTAEALDQLDAEGIPVWGVETTSHARDYRRVAYPSPVALVFGNEALGIERKILERCAAVVQIPLYGYKNSVNVAAACAVIGFRVIEGRL